MRGTESTIDLTVTEGLVACVVVTMDRPELLARCLSSLVAQWRQPDVLVVVDNGDDPVVEAMVAAVPLRTVYLPSRSNLGGAGGYAHGVLTALALGADWVWLADDDGQPGDDWTLSRLLVCAGENELDVVSPLVLDQDDPTRLAFPLRHRLTWITRREQVLEATLVRGTANLFNGTLMSTRSLRVVGVPDLRLFVRGDEVEMHRRVRRSGIGFGTCAAATYLHPQGRDDWQPILGGRLQVLVPTDPARRDVTFRNLGYLTAQRGLRWRRLPDAARYLWWYLAVQHDRQGWARWQQLTRQGRDERFPDVPATRPASGATGSPPTQAPEQSGERASVRLAR